MPKTIPIFGSEITTTVYDPDELIALFLDNTPDGVAIVDLDLRYVRINHMYTNIFGFTESDLIGISIQDLPHTSEVVDILAQVKLGKTYTNLIVPRYHKEGGWLDIAVSYSPLRDSAGNILGVMGIFRDITKLVNMERELKRTRELYKLIADNTTDMIKIYTKDRKVAYASPSHEKGVGIPADELIGKSVYDIIIPDDKDSLDQILARINETKEPEIIQVKLKTAEEEFIFSETNIAPIINEENQIDSYVTVARNISDREKNDAALRNLDRLSIIGQLAAGVAHEIRNPLTSLKGFSKLLGGTKDREKQEEYLSIIMTELDRIDMIVNEFMSLAKPQAIQFKSHSLTSILDSTVNVLHPQAIMNDVQIKINFPKNEIELLCIPNQLKQVFVNFLKNAIEAMPEGGTVHINHQKIEDKRVVINFTDEGVGIDNEILKHLGTPFYTTKDKGIGLGLTVSNKIIQEHHGTMSIESQLGIGTTIKVELPCL